MANVCPPCDVTACIVCAEAPLTVAITPCDHFRKSGGSVLVCGQCVVKMRALLDVKGCPVCRATCDNVFLVSPDTARAHGYSAFQVAGERHAATPSGAKMHYMAAASVFFESFGQMNAIVQLRKFVCTVCAKQGKKGDDPRRQHVFQ